MNPATVSCDDIVAELEQHLAHNILGEGEPIDPDKNLLLEGGVDSLGMIKLVSHIERSFGMEVPPEHFTIENFRSLRVIGNYVRGRLG